MRIRKRFLSSSLSLADPQLTSHSPVQQGSLQPYPDANINSQPSDPPNQRLIMIGSGWPTCLPSQEAERWGDEEEKSTNGKRKESILGAEVGTQILPPSANSSQQEVGRWYQGDKVVPLKKRRSSFNIRAGEEETIPEKVKSKMKAKMNKKCVQLQNGSGDEDQEDYTYEEAKEGINNSGSAKKSKRGSGVMEGSRCSRVNGRGWRCRQQTLVGYALCEHHLGKGRLRSINTTNFRSRAMASDVVVPKKVESISSKMEYINNDEEEDDDDDHDGDEKRPLMMREKMKIGVVKARSIKSLLGET